jgi:hypothetical protein
VHRGAQVLGVGAGQRGGEDRDELALLVRCRLRGGRRRRRLGVAGLEQPAVERLGLGAGGRAELVAQAQPQLVVGAQRLRDVGRCATR